MGAAKRGEAEPTRVAVLGGGVGGITAAFALTATPELRLAGNHACRGNVRRGVHFRFFHPVEGRRLRPRARSEGAPTLCLRRAVDLEDGVGTIGYVCGVLEERAGETQAEAELGIGDQRAQLVIDGELDMVVQTGVEIGRVIESARGGGGHQSSAEPDRAPGVPTLVAGAVFGALGLAEGIARRVGRGVLERRP